MKWKKKMEWVFPLNHFIPSYLTSKQGRSCQESYTSIDITCLFEIPVGATEAFDTTYLGQITIYVWIKLNNLPSNREINNHAIIKKINHTRNAKFTWKTLQCRGKNHGTNPINPL